MPSEASPLAMGCLSCDGAGCGECGNVGSIDIVECPLKMITDDVWDAIEYAGLYKKGLPPVAGGALDQAYSFIAACEFIWGVENYVKRKMKIEG